MNRRVYEYERMISEIPAHARQVMHERYPHIAQMIRRPHARQHQQLRVGDAAAAENDFVALHHKPFAAALHFHARRALALKQQLARHAVRPYGQVKPVARLAEIAQACTPADAVRVVAGNRADAVRIGRVQVVNMRVAELAAGVIERRLRRQPRLALKAVADDRAFAAVKIVLEIGIRLHPAKERQNPLKRPFAIAVSRCPVLEIVRQPAQKHLPVNRASAARNLAPWHKHRLRHIISLARELPVMLVAHHNIRARRIAILQLLRQPLEIRIIRPRLQQQHRPCPILRQPTRRRRARRPRPYDHNIILHGIPAPFA